MGGYGSTRWEWHTAKRCVEESLTLRPSSIKSCLQPHVSLASGQLSWGRGGVTTDTIGYTVRASGDRRLLQLNYTTTNTYTKESTPYDYTVEVQPAPANFGGVRWYFICPLVVNGRPCRRRVACLYLPPNGRYFGCRHCHDLTYRSCRESRKWDSMYASIAMNAGVPLRFAKQAMRDWAKPEKPPKRRYRRRNLG